ncbi:DUF5069 domain-containing protein [Candidatus Poribacteria bacterium]|nr:DUF5069 domain-containing protein [Candidatus Poribacteria bacterium]
MKQKNFRPRDMLNQEVAGICGVARLTDKARAAHAGEIGSYKYGADSEQDTGILSFLGISADSFQLAAVRIDNDIKLGVWVMDNCSRSSNEISKFNRKLKFWWQSKMPRDTYSRRRRELARRRESSESSEIDSVLFMIISS